MRSFERIHTVESETKGANLVTTENPLFRPSLPLHDPYSFKKIKLSHFCWTNLCIQIWRQMSTWNSDSKGSGDARDEAQTVEVRTRGHQHLLWIHGSVVDLLSQG